MTDDVDRSSWLLEPPGAGEVRLVVELGEGAELTPEVQSKLEELMSELNQSEVEGFAFGGSFGPNIGLFGSIRLQGSCQKLVCDRHDCERHSCDQYKSNRFV